ncbi:MAG: FRG domain-containing protein [Candidatus Hydrogenedentes bacterium]|nr:FRG domain-containing protein [Candidatus Hydrogenedentota bacterium]
MSKVASIESVDEFLDEISRWRGIWGLSSGVCVPSDIRYGVFRGQADCEWSLRSKVSRIPTGSQTVYDLEWDLFSAWRRRFVGYPSDLVPNSGNGWEMLASAQHFGLPTRLLDWTTHPLHALFFACIGEPRNVAGSVFGFLPSAARIESLDRANISLNPIAPLLKNDVGRVYLYWPHWSFSKRLKNQMGVFTIQTRVTMELPEALEEASPEGVVEIREVRIASGAKPYIEGTLREHYGIGYEKMFPEPEGLAKQICREYCPGLVL